MRGPASAAREERGRPARSRQRFAAGGAGARVADDRGSEWPRSGTARSARGGRTKRAARAARGAGGRARGALPAQDPAQVGARANKDARVRSRRSRANDRRRAAPPTPVEAALRGHRRRAVEQQHVAGSTSARLSPMRAAPAARARRGRGPGGRPQRMRKRSTACARAAPISSRQNSARDDHLLAVPHAQARGARRGRRRADAEKAKRPLADRRRFERRPVDSNRLATRDDVLVGVEGQSAGAAARARSRRARSRTRRSAPGAREQSAAARRRGPRAGLGVDEAQRTRLRGPRGVEDRRAEVDQEDLVAQAAQGVLAASSRRSTSLAITTRPSRGSAASARRASAPDAGPLAGERALLGRGRREREHPRGELHEAPPSARGWLLEAGEDAGEGEDPHRVVLPRDTAARARQARRPRDRPIEGPDRGALLGDVGQEIEGQVLVLLEEPQRRGRGGGRRVQPMARRSSPAT